MSIIDSSVKRVKLKIKASQNPLFEKWLTEWRNEAAEKGSDMQYCFSKALKSLKKFPVKLYSGKECMMLENFGAKLCQKLDAKLEEYKASHPDDLSVYPTTENKSPIKSNVMSEELTKVTERRKSGEVSPTKKKKSDTANDNKSKNSNYIPAYRSGGYAILIAMFDKLQDTDFKGYLTRTEIENYAQDLCDSSFKKPSSGSYYTAWSSISVLIRKKLVTKQGKPLRFGLTEEGIDLAIKLKNTNQQLKEADCNITPKKTNQLNMGLSPVKNSKVSPLKFTSDVLSQETEPESVSEADETVFMLSGTFEIVLLVDTQERDDKCQHSDGMTMQELKSRHVNFEIRHLKVGDFIWIARDLHSGFELVLPYIVERKRFDDLSSSIKDGRFHEQKFRLKQSGIENLIYLVEKYGNENQRLGLPLPTLMQAISNTQIVDGFSIRVTDNHNHSMRYLDCMTTQLNNLFKSKTLMSCKKMNLSPTNLSDDLISLMTFRDFNKGSEKNKKLTIRNMLVKHLIQLSGVSIEKAQAIVKRYPTPKVLIQGLKQSCGEKSIAEVTYGNFNRSIGPTTAKQIRMLYTSMNLR